MPQMRPETVISTLRTRRTRRIWSPTPICDEIRRLTGGETLATWNSSRGYVGMDGKRHPGGEWDPIRAVPLRIRRSLTAAGFMSRDGMYPDAFADLLAGNGAPESETIAWYLRQCRFAVKERQRAENRDRHASLALAGGHSSYYEHRQALVQSLGYRSVWDYRKAKGWT